MARAQLDLAELLGKQVEGIQLEAQARDLTLQFSAEARSCAMEGDSHLLGRVVQNLVENALQYTRAGGSVHVTCGARGNAAWFSVTDTGPGIPAEDLPNLFAPLYRGETSRSRRTGGAGLGLTIARRIVLAYGGDIEARNCPEGGAVFTARLPRAPA